MPPGSDPGLQRVAEAFGVGPDDELGHGGEAWVYALGGDRVLRVLHPGGRLATLERADALVRRLRRTDPPFALPVLLEAGAIGGRVFAVERRLPGRPVSEVLAALDGPGRQELVVAHLEAAAALGRLDPGHLDLGRRRLYGDLVADDALESETWPGYLEGRAAANLARSVPELAALDPAALARAMPDAGAPGFVHIDAFAGNMLTDGTAITAVIDIGAAAVAGDRHLSAVAAVCYLEAPEITPAARADDRAVARRWLEEAGLESRLAPARAWLAAYWSFAVNDPVLLGWCRRVLVAPAPPMVSGTPHPPPA